MRRAKFIVQGPTAFIVPLVLQVGMKLTLVH